MLAVTGFSYKETQSMKKPRRGLTLGVASCECTNDR